MVNIMKNTQYYLYDSYSSVVYKIGEEGELLEFLSLFYNKIKDNINVNGNDKKSPYEVYRCFDFKSGSFITVREKVEPLVKRYLFFNNDGRIVDIRSFENRINIIPNVFSYYTIEKYFEKPKKKHKKTKLQKKQIKHTNYKKTYLLDSIPEYKEFSKSKNKRYRNHSKKEQEYSKISRSWKDQCKCTRQYSKHKRNRNSTDSIRYYDEDGTPFKLEYETDFEEYDMIFTT